MMTKWILLLLLFFVVSDGYGQQRQSIDTIADSLYNKVITGLMEYKEVKHWEDTSAESGHLDVRMVIYDPMDNGSMSLPCNTIKYMIGYYDHGAPCGWMEVYDVFYSVTDWKIIRILDMFKEDYPN